MSAGGDHTCGIRTSGRLYCWGSDQYGQLGNGIPNQNEDTPFEVAGNHTDWTAVTTGLAHTCALRSTGRLYCWGVDQYGQLGNRTPNAQEDVPVEVAGGATNWAAVNAGDLHTCARKTTGRLYCWGNDTYGQLGNRTPNASRSAPVEVSLGLTTWTGFDAGSWHTCARRRSGRLYCWGLDDNGQLGNGAPNASRSVPVEVGGGATTWTTVATGYAHTCAGRANGRLYCWGSDSDGQLGNGAPNAGRPAPVLVAGGATNWATVSAGGLHTCARKTIGRLYCWGRDLNGQLGNGAPNAGRPAPVDVNGGATGWTQVTAGYSHSCARRATGRLYCWGNNFSLQLGNGGLNAEEPAPVEVS